MRGHIELEGQVLRFILFRLFILFRHSTVLPFRLSFIVQKSLNPIYATQPFLLTFAPDLKNTLRK